MEKKSLGGRKNYFDNIYLAAINGYNWDYQVIVDKQPQWPADSDSSELQQSAVWTAVCCSNCSPSADTWLGETQVTWSLAICCSLPPPPERETARTKRSADARRVSGPGACCWVVISNFDIDVHQHSHILRRCILHTLILTRIEYVSTSRHFQQA